MSGFASELPLSQGYHSMHMDSQEVIIQAKPGSLTFALDQR